MKVFVTSLLLVAFASPGWAVLGLPYAQEAAVYQGDMQITGGLTIGELPDSDGEVDVLMLGGRFSYGVMDGLQLFGGFGLIDVDVDMDDDPDAPDFDFDNEPYLQIGALYTLPLDLPFDLGLRGSLGYARLEDSIRESEIVGTPGGGATMIHIDGDIDVDLLSMNIGLLGSYAINPTVSVYGFGGVSHTRLEMDMSARVTSEDAFVSQMLAAQGQSRMSDSETETSTDLAVAGGLLLHVVERFSLYAEVAHIDEVWASAGGRLTF